MPRILETECIGCNVCAESCPRGAITVDTVARIDTYKCSGCGQCVRNCPLSAVIW
ncbi:MAG: 4Fe-4S binding protein [Candidatus Methanomethylophilaceae archaeon]